MALGRAHGYTPMTLGHTVIPDGTKHAVSAAVVEPMVEDTWITFKGVSVT